MLTTCAQFQFASLSVRGRNRYEVRLVPEDATALDAMFKAMSVCQELHPDPSADDSGDDESGGGMLMEAMFGGGGVGAGGVDYAGEGGSGMRGVDGYYDSEEEIEMTEPGRVQWI